MQSHFVQPPSSADFPQPPILLWMFWLMRSRCGGMILHPPSQGMFGSVWSHFRLSCWQAGATGIQWVEARDAVECLQCTGEPTAQNYPDQSVSSAQLEKPAPAGYTMLQELFNLIFFLVLVFFPFLIEVQLIYNVVLFPAVQQSESVIYIYSFSDSFPLWVITRY